MFLTLPIQRPHQLKVHYRTAQIRRTFERHAYVAHSDSPRSDKLAQDSQLPEFPLLVELKPMAGPSVSVEHADQSLVPIPRLLVRLKLGSPFSGSQDPLL